MDIIECTPPPLPDTCKKKKRKGGLKKKLTLGARFQKLLNSQKGARFLKAACFSGNVLFPLQHCYLLFISQCIF